MPSLLRRLGLFDATMLVMGGIVGSGIFINPYVVAQQVHTPFLILGAWAAGGAVALAGAFVYAELAARRPQVGGQYAYLREAFHPSVAFVYGWVLLLVTQTGGMAAVSVTFSRYFLEITHSPIPEGVVAAAALALLTIVNCFGVRAGSTVQSALMVLKIVAIAALVVAGFLFIKPAAQPAALLDRPLSMNLLTAFGAAMTPVLFAYGGWQTSSFVAGEMKDPSRDLPRALLIGVVAVIILYMSVTFVCLRALGVGATGRNQNPRIGSDARRTGRARSHLHRTRHRDLDTRIPEPRHAHRPASLFRHGARWIVLPQRSLARSANRRAGSRDRAARSSRGDHRVIRPL